MNDLASSHEELHVYRCATKRRASSEADPVTTEIVRHSLNSAANQMKQALCRTSFSPIIYEVLDFASALYDREYRMLAQSPSLPLFMGTLNFCVEAAIDAIGGVGELEEGDILIYNNPYGTGSHQQDVALILPAFVGSALVGYAAIKAHWLDIGGKDVYCTDTIDLFQEGTIYPGVKLFRRGELDPVVHRIILANSRLPTAIDGDMRAQCVGVRAGVAALCRIVNRFGLEQFEACVERMFDHGEAVVREYFRRIPDGTYVGKAMMDSDGLSEDTIPFEVVLRVDNGKIVLDFSGSPPMTKGPLNCPFPSTVSASRTAVSMLAGGGESPNEGHFRAIEVVTRPGTLFHPVNPAPCFLYGWPAIQALDAIYRAIADAMPGLVPADSGGDLAGFLWFGQRTQTGEPWVGGGPNPVGQGASETGDGTTLMHIAESATRVTPVEVTEARFPMLVECQELAPDTCGAGRTQGGLGLLQVTRALEPCFGTSVLERTLMAPRGLQGGTDATPNACHLTFPDGGERALAKATHVELPEGTRVTITSGGGGGYGSPAERSVEQIKSDIVDGYISEAFAREHYPHAYDSSHDLNMTTTAENP